jgi:hypothetical protein
MTDDLLLGLFNQILDRVFFLLISTNELLLLPRPPFRDISNELYLVSVKMIIGPGVCGRTFPIGGDIFQLLADGATTILDELDVHPPTTVMVPD